MDFLLYFYQIISNLFFVYIMKPLLKWYVGKRQGKSDLTKMLLDGNKSLGKVLKIENELRKSRKNAIRDISQLRLMHYEDIGVYVDFIMEQEGETWVEKWYIDGN